jgi:hypothetical protein
MAATSQAGGWRRGWAKSLAERERQGVLGAPLDAGAKRRPPAACSDEGITGGAQQATALRNLLAL